MDGAYVVCPCVQLCTLSPPPYHHPYHHHTETHLCLQAAYAYAKLHSTCASLLRLLVIMAYDVCAVPSCFCCSLFFASLQAAPAYAKLHSALFS